eukprot:c24373_g1_i1 orf=352-1839(-)
MAASWDLAHSDARSKVEQIVDDARLRDLQHSNDGIVGRQGTTDPWMPTDASVDTKDAGKKKRVNRAAKLKQCKLDVRREQWLAQGKPIKSDLMQTQIDNPIKSESPNGIVSETRSPHPGERENNCNDGFSTLITYDMGKRQMDVTAEGKKNRAPNGMESPIITPKVEFPLRMQFLDTRTGGKDGGLCVINVPIPGSEDKEQKIGNDDPDVVQVESSLSFAAESKIERGDSDISEVRGKPSARVEGIAVEKPQTRRPGCDYSRRSSSDMSVSLSRSSSSLGTSGSGSSLSSSSCAGSGSDGDDDNRGAEDDWETAADMLHVQDSPQHKHHPLNDQSTEPSFKGSDSSVKRSMGLLSSDLQNSVLKPQYKYKSGPFGNRIRGNAGKAWRPDDVYRPPTLPRLSKQLSFPLQPGIPAWSSVHGNMWGSSPAPSYCPICTEELDVTDSSFLPCVCGFRLCLFCHHKISSDDGRCPGCRKLYNSEGAMKLSRSSTVRPRV